MLLSSHAAYARRMLLETISHCWLYPRILAFHLSAYLLHPPQRCRVRVTICHAPAADDPATAETIAYFRQQPLPDSVAWNFLELPRRQLCRRAIGRNIACKQSPADFVLMGDVDYIFGAGALDACAVQMPRICAEGPRLMHLGYVSQSIDHAAGDAEIARVSCPQVIELTHEAYRIKGLARAIGGCQYIPGDFARDRGYLSDSKRFQRPTDEWRKTRCDVAFRSWSGLESIALHIPNVYRIRHGMRGRHDIGVQL